METRILNYFLKIAQTGNITKAAQELHITQPTLSRQLQDLETQLGIKLFERKNRKMILTSAGLIYQQKVSKILDELDSLNSEIANNDTLTGTINIGCVSSNITNFLSDKIIQFREKYSSVKFNIYSGDGDIIKQKMDDGQLDLGFVLSPVEIAKYNYRKLAIKDNWALIGNKNSFLKDKTEISLASLKDLPLIVPSRKIIQELLTDEMDVSEQDLNIIGYQNLPNGILPLIEAGIGYGLIVEHSYEYYSPELVIKPIADLAPVSHTFIWNKNSSFSTSTEKFKEFILQ